MPALLLSSVHAQEKLGKVNSSIFSASVAVPAYQRGITILSFFLPHTGVSFVFLEQGELSWTSPRRPCYSYCYCTSHPESSPMFCPKYVGAVVKDL